MVATHLLSVVGVWGQSVVVPRPYKVRVTVDRLTASKWETGVRGDPRNPPPGRWVNWAPPEPEPEPPMGPPLAPYADGPFCCNTEARLPENSSERGFSYLLQDEDGWPATTVRCYNTDSSQFGAQMLCRQLCPDPVCGEAFRLGNGCSNCGEGDPDCGRPGQLRHGADGQYCTFQRYETGDPRGRGFCGTYPRSRFVSRRECGDFEEWPPPPPPPAPPPPRSSEFVIEVNPAWAPIGAAHFCALVDAGFFSQNRFFRVIWRYITQWGLSLHDPSSEFSQPIQDDPYGVQTNSYGTVCFATAGRNTRTTQVFINTNPYDNPNLDDLGYPGRLAGLMQRAWK